MPTTYSPFTRLWVTHFWLLLLALTTLSAAFPSACLVRSTSFSSSSSSSSIYLSSTGSQDDPPREVIPVTILSGFLGSGKTTLLTQLLQNKQGLQVAVVVNDVASVNIDSKLVRQDPLSLSDGMVELQNGCACCSLSDELLNSVSELVMLSDLRQGNDEEKRPPFQHIVVELSGVADPKQVRAKFQEAAFAGMPLMERVRLDTMVTVIDASMFESYFESSKTASRTETPELFGGDSQEELDIKDQEEWMKDMPPKLLQAVMASLRGDDETNGVAELLVSQTETADVVVLNKCDLSTEQDMNRLQEIVTALNPRASVLQTTYGKVPLTSFLAVAKGEGVAVSGAVDDHRDYVSAAMRKQQPDHERKHQPASSHSHDHDHDCTEPNCMDDSHFHAHDHECSDPNCTDESHSHDHAHSHSHDCSDPNCADESHSHSHAHGSMEESVACMDPTCNDPNHSHVHSHSSSNDSPHSGIGTFVYRARRPFHPGRFVRFLHFLPVVRGIPESQDKAEDALDIPSQAQTTLASTLRSKGFCWCADSHISAMYWSQAGKSFELSCLGQWWATLPRDQWPEGVEDYVLQDFDDPKHEDGSSDCSCSVGDRRQEVVFIGPKFDSAEQQGRIQKALDQCLLTNEEYEEYRNLQNKETELQVRFSNVMESKYVNF